jgi:hypothetical protein
MAANCHEASSSKKLHHGILRMSPVLRTGVTKFRCAGGCFCNHHQGTDMRDIQDLTNRSVSIKSDVIRRRCFGDCVCFHHQELIQ